MVALGRGAIGNAAAVDDGRAAHCGGNGGLNWRFAVHWRYRIVLRMLWGSRAADDGGRIAQSNRGRGKLLPSGRVCV